MIFKLINTVVLLFVIVTLSSHQVLAHKVIASVYASQNTIEGEIGFSNGVMAKGVEVIVTGPDGLELGRVITDDQGFFVFTPVTAVPHLFRANLGLGHVALVRMETGELPTELVKTLRKNAPARASSQDRSLKASSRKIPGIDMKEKVLVNIVAEAVRREVKPLRRELAAYRDNNNFQNILGGIGYIFGLFGLGFYIAARRRLSNSTSNAD